MGAAKVTSSDLLFLYPYPFIKGLWIQWKALTDTFHQKFMSHTSKLLQRKIFKAQPKQKDNII